MTGFLFLFAACIATYVATLLLTPLLTVVMGFVRALLPGERTQPVSAFQLIIYCMADLGALGAGWVVLNVSNLSAFFPVLFAVVITNTLVYCSGRFTFPTEEAARKNRRQKLMSFSGTLLAVLIAACLSLGGKG